MNTTPNRGIHGYSPYLPHFSSHCSATVAKLNEIRYTLHQTRSMNLFLRQPNRQRICIGSKVRIKLKQNVFRKKNPIFNSLWSDSIYEISDYDCKRWPVTYQIKELPHKIFYSHQLLKVANSDPILTTGDSPMSKIKVLDIEHQNSMLRNMKTIPSHHEIKYRIMKNGDQELVDAKDLLFFKKIYGDSILEYSPFFQDKNNVSYIL